MAGLVNEQIHKLIEDNREIFQGKPVAFDGIVNEEVYFKSSIRTAFLLKEVNVTDKIKDWEYIPWLRDYQANSNEKLYKTFPNICLWVEILKKMDTNYQSCFSNGWLDKERLRKNLNEVAIINIKKTYGKGNSDYEEILSLARNDTNKRLLREEINYTKADLVICGGTFECAESIYGIMPEKILILNSGAHYFRADDHIFLEFVHPMWFNVNRNILFAYASIVFNELNTICFKK